MKSLVEFFLSKSIFVNLLTFLVILIGGFTAVKMNREAFPNINFDIVSVVTVFPGASPSEMEKLVTKPLEEAIQEVDGIKEFRSASIENRSGIVITLDPDSKNTQKVVDDIKSAIDRVEDLPEEAEDPIVTEITTSRQPVIEINISLKSNDSSIEAEKHLKAQAKIVEQALEDIPGVARISKRGWRDTEMQVDIDPVAMFSKYLTSQDIIFALKNRNINFPGGNIAGNQKEVILRTIGEFNSPKEIETVHVRSNEVGNSIRIDNVARVTEGLKEAEYLDKVNGKKTIALTVIKREKADAILVVDEAKKIIEEFKKNSKNEFEYAFVNDLSKYIRRRLGVLLSNAIGGLILVTASLFLFLGWRVALMTALGIPVSFGATFVIMDYLGLTLNLISMFGLIIVVGILVDDAIIICENVYRYMEEGMPAYEAALKGTSEVIDPVTATVTTTVAAFAPMLFMTGIFGKFIYSIPLVVIIALLASLSEAFFILPSHLYDINKHKFHSGEIKEESGWFYKLKVNYYLPLLKFALKHRLQIFIYLFAMLVGSFALFAVFGRFKLFPGSVDVFQIKLTGQTGISLQEMEKFTHALETELAKISKEEIENYVTRVGIIQKDPNDPFTKRGKHYAQVLVYMTPEENRKRGTDTIISEIREKTIWLLNEKSVKTLEETRKKEAEKKKEEYKPFNLNEYPAEFSRFKGQLLALDFEKLAGGPPVGKPVAIEIRGDDYDTLIRIGEEYKSVMAKVPGVTDIGDDFNEGKDEIRIKVNESLASTAGVSVFKVAQAINTAFQGTVATKIKRADEEVEVKVRFPEEVRKSIGSLNNIFVSNQLGKLIPVSRLIDYVREPGFANINHLDGKRLLTVTANLDEIKTDTRRANAEIAKLSKGIIDKYPGYRMRFGGENKDTEESLASLGRAFLVAFIIIFMILASLFRSLIQPVIVVSSIPFSLIGVILAFVLHGEYFGFLAFLGIVGLAGVVVNDSIVLVDFANQLKLEKPGEDIDSILVETGLLRLRPVVLTTVTTVLGLLPTAYGIGGKDPFLVPMALAFGWGLAFSSFLTLVAVPVLYKTVHNVQLKINRVFLKSKR
ncbi:export membrane protein [Leptospira interrogans serovar Grippotyphosa str. UI 12769]|uniref:Export membrane protein n=1 Tax=Leptospira interrogans str. 2006001854 TaxID=1001590 RepID=M6GCP0_LEPIR|nr:MULTISPECIES: efflux RND transporter permease subunit [Leptospira]EMM82733.1 export membrane protein [Leptospira interrogans str. 2006001854]EKR43097.1 export membrane protein [Leptospira interrogans serovar Grippotyphosa str. UI 08368]EMN65353.1 export membrane protein [Leptospira interrogans serovar Grippotyphosa str. UI 08434]EMN87345.1 export membrane protein [Leptospira interrogans serovar Grippotyphosa str. UI 12769]EMO95242.1 export membrane protein [Leptospira interrogans str. UI 13